MRIALAGLGSAAARAHLPAIAGLSGRRTGRLVAAADPDPARRDEAAAAVGRVPLFGSAEEMLATVAADLLVVAAEPAAHAQLIELGVERGLHVVCEKPLVVTRSQYERVAEAHVRHPDKAIVSVHQYRYSPTWIWMSRCARAAARLRIPFSLAVEVRRPGVDVLATSSWRADVSLSGGMLADHGVHYLALAWTVDQHLDVLAGLRTWGEEGERSGASCRIGSGVLTVRVETGAPDRQTRVGFHAAGVDLGWHNQVLDVKVGGRTVASRQVKALADRDHVNALYGRFYEDLARNLHRRGWRAHHTAEALVVGRALVGLLETNRRLPAPA